MTTAQAPVYKKKDFESDQENRWCPGCGDYAILNAVQQSFAQLGVPKEKFVIVSGIGCSSRFTYYMDTYGFHTIHGRPTAVASGIKIANPELQVWVVCGDGDGFSIGGNHMIHSMRRNIDIKVLVFNNRIYGLTKGQYSPTSEQGKRTGSTPYGSLDHPFNPIALALGAGSTFVARTVDTQIPHTRKILQAAHEHEGFAFVEILQNCVIFNNKAFEHITSKGVRDERQIDLRPGQPMVFGAGLERGLRFTPDAIEIVGASEADLWDPTGASGARAYRVCQNSEHDELPVPMGIFRQVQRPILDRQIHAQVEDVSERLGPGTLESLLNSGDTWEVR